MSYHRFSNLRELFQQDLSYKINMDLESKDFQSLPCNCRPGQDGGCKYNNVCRRSVVVYKVECQVTGKVYIGSTQQHLKTRMQQHHTQVAKLHALGERSTSHAKHFARLFVNFPKVTPKLHRNSVTHSVIWQGNPISAVKTFGTNHCMLCNRERLEILKMARFKPHLLINSCNGIYGACRHKFTEVP